MANEKEQAGKQGEQQRAAKQAGQQASQQGQAPQAGLQQGEQRGQGQGQGQGMQRREGGQGMQSPFSFMRRFSEEMDRLMSDFGFGSLSQTLWAPQVEIFLRDDKLIVRADVPGLDKNDVQLEIVEGELVLQGERKQEREENRGGMYRSERSYGRFYRAIPLPEGADIDSAQANFKDGVLEIEIPVPAQQSRGRRIEIRDGSVH